MTRSPTKRGDLRLRPAVHSTRAGISTSSGRTMQTLLKLLSEGQYVNVLTSRQMGKSSLMVRTAEALIERGVRCAIVDLAAELGSPENTSTYFLGLLNKIARDLKIKVDLPAWWVERAEETVNQRLMRFFREVVLERVPGPVVCFLDEIDSTLKLPWTDDLFTALRGMHNERPMVPAYERLTFCLIGVASPNELIKDRRTTPYNVGSTLELRDFDLARDDLTPLIDALGANPEQGRRLIERVLYWTGGHPYLTARLCASLREIDAQAPEDVDRRIDDAFHSLERVSGDVHFQQVLRFLETRVADGLATFGLYEKILKGARERDQPTAAYTELKLSGLVKRDEEGCLVVRNRIYERLFDYRWIESTRPRRALTRYRRSAIAAGIALTIGLVVAGGWITSLQRELNQAVGQTSQFSGTPEFLGTHRDWNVYAFTEDSQSICHMASEPTKQEGDYTRRGNPAVVVTRRPGSPAVDEVSVQPGYTFREGSEVEVEIDGREFTMFTRGELAWTKSEDTDRALIDAMKRGSEMTVRGSSPRASSPSTPIRCSASPRPIEAMVNACRG